MSISLLTLVLFFKVKQFDANGEMKKLLAIKIFFINTKSSITVNGIYKAETKIFSTFSYMYVIIQPSLCILFVSMK